MSFLEDVLVRLQTSHWSVVLFPATIFSTFYSQMILFTEKKIYSFDLLYTSFRSNLPIEFEYKSNDQWKEGLHLKSLRKALLLVSSLHIEYIFLWSFQISSKFSFHVFSYIVVANRVCSSAGIETINAFPCYWVVFASSLIIVIHFTSERISWKISQPSWSYFAFR